MIKIMIVDDHDMVRLGLRTYLSLESDVLVVGEAGNGRDALALLKDGFPLGMPDIILLDMIMPLMDGITTAQELNKQYPHLKIIMLTSFLEDDKVLQAIEAGAVNYVLKTISSEELLHVIRGVYSGSPTMSSEVSQSLARGLRIRSTQSSDENFTLREKEVLLLIADGKANKEIAEELHISIKTVKTHVSNLLMKCELEDRTQLAIFAHRKGWVKK